MARLDADAVRDIIENNVSTDVDRSLSDGFVDGLGTVTRLANGRYVVSAEGESPQVFEIDVEFSVTVLEVAA